MVRFGFGCNIKIGVIIAVLFCLLQYSGFAQFLRNFRSKPTTFQWGWNVIDDNANTYRQLININSSYSDAFPGKFSAMKTLSGRLKGELNLGFAKMKQSYYKDRYIYPGVFTCVDFNFRVQFNPLDRFSIIYIYQEGAIVLGIASAIAASILGPFLV